MKYLPTIGLVPQLFKGKFENKMLVEKKMEHFFNVQ